jgi:DNA-binding NarL/FixJ family response regulator
MNEQSKQRLNAKVRELPFIASCRFAPKALDVLDMLLTGESEKKIAVLLNQKPGTTHDYVKQIYRQIGISSRAELFSMVLHAVVADNTRTPDDLVLADRRASNEQGDCGP